MAAGNIAKALRANNYLAPVADVVKNYYAKQAEQQRKKQLLDLQTNVINNLNAAMQPKQVTEQQAVVTMPKPQTNQIADFVPDEIEQIQQNTLQNKNNTLPYSQQIEQEPITNQVGITKTILPTPQQRQEAINTAQMEYLQGLQGMTDDPQAQQALSSQIIAATIAKLKPQTPQTVKLGGNEAIYEQDPTTGEYLKKIDNRIIKEEDVKTYSVIRNEGRKKYVDIYKVDKDGNYSLDTTLPAGEKDVSVGGNGEKNFNPGNTNSYDKILDELWNNYRKLQNSYSVEAEFDKDETAESRLEYNKGITTKRNKILDDIKKIQHKKFVTFSKDAKAGSTMIKEFELLVQKAGEIVKAGYDPDIAIQSVLDAYMKEKKYKPEYDIVREMFEQEIPRRVFQ